MGKFDVETLFHRLAKNRVLMIKRLHSALELLGVLHYLEQGGENLYLLLSSKSCTMIVESSPLPDHRGILPTEMPSDTAGTTGTPGKRRVFKVRSFSISPVATCRWPGGV